MVGAVVSRGASQVAGGVSIVSCYTRTTIARGFVGELTLVASRSSPLVTAGATTGTL